METETLKLWMSALLKGREGRPPMLEDIRRYMHIEDWLKSAYQHEAPFTKDLDNNGVPRKLKHLDIDGAMNAADKWFRRLNKARLPTQDDGGTEVVMDFGDGFRWVRLLTVESLQYEGALMRHCLGGGSYDDDLESGDSVFYSLRDANNKPHVTIEVSLFYDLAPGVPYGDGGHPPPPVGYTLEQCNGKANAIPHPKYRKYVRPLVFEHGWKLDGMVCETGLVRGADGILYDMDDLPDCLVIDGDANFDKCGIRRLPRNLTVTGELTITGNPNITELPEGLDVGALDMRGCNIERIPSDMKVGLLNAGSSKLREIPAGFAFRDNAFLGYTQIRRIPDNVEFHGDVDFEYCAITEIGNNVTFHGKLYLKGSSIVTDMLSKARFPGTSQWVAKTAAVSPALNSLRETLALGGQCRLGIRETARQVQEGLNRSGVLVCPPEQRAVVNAMWAEQERYILKDWQ